MVRELSVSGDCPRINWREGGRERGAGEREGGRERGEGERIEDRKKRREKERM